MAQKYGYRANEAALASRPCVVCDTSHPTYSWTDYSGEGYCTTCGTTYQLQWGELKEGESYPRLNVREECVPMLRRYFAETKALNGCGTYLGMDEYPEQRAGMERMAEWWREHKHEYPQFGARQGDAPEGRSERPR